MGGAAVFSFVVLGLHVLQPEFSPSKNLISELASHRLGWTMYIAFLSLAAAFLGLQLAVGQLGASRSLRMLLGIAAAAFGVAGIVTLDRSVLIHLGSVVVAFIAAVLSMYLFPTTAGKAASAGPKAVSWSLAIGMGLGILLGFMVLPVGTGQRITAVFLVCWLEFTGWKVGATAI